MNHDRRRFLLSAALASTSPAWASTAWSAEAPAPPGAAPIPASGDGTVMLDAHPLASDGPAGAKPDLGYAPTSPGPLVRLKRGVATRIRLTNRIGEPTSLDWHGMRLPNALETVPGLIGMPIATGANAEILLTPADSGTYWFHAGLLAGMDDQTARGLAGVVVVEEPDPPPTDGDKTLILTDRQPVVGAASSPQPGPPSLQSRLQINGKAWPDSDALAPGARIRLRIVNGSTREAFAASFQGGAVMVIAIDGQPSELFRPLNDSVPVGPGARFDVLIDLARTPGAEFKLLLRGSDAVAASPVESVAYVAKATGTPLAERPPMHSLTPNPALPRVIPLEHATRVDMTVRIGPATQSPNRAAWSVNGTVATALPKKPLFSVRRNSPVTLGFTNASTQLTAFRLHGHVMRLLHAMDDGWEPYWRDSVIVPPGITHHATFLADNPGKWLIESPFFDQAAGGLRTWFEVI